MDSSPFALYYPHTELRDENWLKAALLYWDGGIQRIVPDGYVPPDSQAVKAAYDEGLVRDVPPMRYLNEATAVFNDRLEAILGDVSADALRPLGEYVDVRSDFHEADTTSVGGALMRSLARQPGPFDASLGALHIDKMDEGLREQLVQLNLARIYGRDLVMNRALVAMYMTILADIISKASGFPIISDRQLYAQFGRRVAYGPLKSEVVDTGQDLLMALHALKIDFPSGDQLAGVPMSRILEFRSQRISEMRRFRKAINETMVGILAAEPLKQQALEYEARAEIKEAINDYHRTLSEVGFSTAKGAMTLTAPAAVKSVALQAGNITLLGGVVSGSALLIGLGFAVSTLFVVRDALVKRKSASRSNDYQYLLELKKLVV